MRAQAHVRTGRESLAGDPRPRELFLGDFQIRRTRGPAGSGKHTRGMREYVDLHAAAHRLIRMIRFINILPRVYTFSRDVIAPAPGAVSPQPPF